MLLMAACGPLIYVPEKDDALMQLGLAQWYDEDAKDTVEWNTKIPLFARDGSILPEWYDFKAAAEHGEPPEVEITIDFKCRFSIVQHGCPTREAAVADAMQEWERIKSTINNVLDYVRITEVSKPVVK
jgi:hypothetical protein